MPVVTLVHATARDGEEDAIERCLNELRSLSVQEPGNVTYDVWRDQRDRRRFLVYEVYRDEEGRTAHRSAEYTQRMVQQVLRPACDEFVVAQYGPLA
jgi:quinol monooxygenase YgiN